MAIYKTAGRPSLSKRVAYAFGETEGQSRVPLYERFVASAETFTLEESRDAATMFLRQLPEPLQEPSKKAVKKAKKPSKVTSKKGTTSPTKPKATAKKGKATKKATSKKADSLEAIVNSVPFPTSKKSWRFEKIRNLALKGDMEAFVAYGDNLVDVRGEPSDRKAYWMALKAALKS